MNIVINTAGFSRFFDLSPEMMFWVSFYNVGWLILAAIFLIERYPIDEKTYVKFMAENATLHKADTSKDGPEP